jgi:rubrerythrin
MSDSKQVLVEILKKAYQIEVDGYTFYSMAADKASKPAVQELFAKLAKDETEHKAFITNIMKNYNEKGSAAFSLGLRPPQEMREFSDALFTEKFKEQAKEAAFEMGALSVGMTLEQNAILHFTNAARQSTEKEVKDFYTFLANWEKQHFDALQKLSDAIRSNFWSDSPFAPF